MREAVTRWYEHKLRTDERPKIRYEYFVTGHGMFPVDMLRYDSCWPASGEDAAKIEWGYTETGNRRTRSIRLRSHHMPTIDRWSSFNWSVGTRSLEREADFGPSAA